MTVARALVVESNLPEGITRRLVEWTWLTSSRSPGARLSRHWSRILNSEDQRILLSLVNASPTTCG